MAYLERGSLKAAESTLEDAGFDVSELCTSRPSCFDIAARKGKSIVFIKVQHDIGSFSKNDSAELKAISDSFEARCLLIGDEAREKPLQDDTVYTRQNITAVTPKTFENVVLHNVLPLIQANPGGYYVEIDGDSLKRRRQELGLSAGEMAQMVKTSRRTIYGYEKGMAKASVPAAYNLISTLGIPVAKSVNILQKPNVVRKSHVLTTAKIMLSRNRILGKLIKRWVKYHVTAVRRAPFDFLLGTPQEKVRIIGGIANKKETELDRRIDEILSIGRLVGASPILIIEGQPPEKEILCISSEEVSKIRDPEELILRVKRA